MAKNRTEQDAISLQQFLPYRLVNLAQRISINFAEIYQSEFNLTMPEWRALVHLAEHSNVGQQGDINESQSDSAKLGTSQFDKTRSAKRESAEPDFAKPVPAKSGISAKELTILASMDKSTVSRAVKLMLDKGYISKLSQESDKRAYTLALTVSGFTLYQTIAPKALAWEAKLLEVLDTDEYQTLMRVLNKLDEGLNIQLE